MPLTDAKVRAAKPQSKTYRLSDERGMYLEVTPTGGKYWRFKYRVLGREKRLAIGVYPTVSLSEARKSRDEARLQLASGIDPSANKKAERLAKSGADSFEQIAREWYESQSTNWAPSHADKVIGRLNREVFPWIGSIAANKITAPDLLELLRRIEFRGHVETAHRTHQIVSRVFRYAIATGRAERDPAADLRGALKPYRSKNLASIKDPKRAGELLRAIDSFSGTFVVLCALKLAPLVFVRPGELRGANWAEFDLAKAEWRIPAERMKMRSPHLIPLSRQSVAILNELQPFTGPVGYVFPSARSRTRSMSENAITAALRRLEYSGDEMTGHGFRSMASTLLHEQGWNPHAIERQLAHAEGNTVKAAYNYAEYLDERRKMMQAWADYLDVLKEGCSRETPF